MASDAAASASSWQTLLVAAAWIRLNLSRCGFFEGVIRFFIVGERLNTLHQSSVVANLFVSRIRMEK
jgi:hypothetical protein